MPAGIAVGTGTDDGVRVGVVAVGDSVGPDGTGSDVAVGPKVPSGVVVGDGVPVGPDVGLGSGVVVGGDVPVGPDVGLGSDVAGGGVVPVGGGGAVGCGAVGCDVLVGSGALVGRCGGRDGHPGGLDGGRPDGSRHHGQSGKSGHPPSDAETPYADGILMPGTRADPDPSPTTPGITDVSTLTPSTPSNRFTPWLTDVLLPPSPDEGPGGNLADPAEIN